MAQVQELKRWWFRQTRPVTLVLIGLCILGALAVFVNPAIVEFLGFTPGKSGIWTILTYPFAIGDLLGGFGLLFFVFLCMWLYSIGGQVEGELGSKIFLATWVFFTVFPALLFFAFSKMAMASLSGTLMPVSALTVIWASRNANAQVMMMGLIPMAAKWVGWLMVGIVFFRYGTINLALGAVATLPLALAFAWATGRIPGLPYYTVRLAAKQPTKAQIMKENAFRDDVQKRKQEREERERLRKLFESSLNEDDKR